MWWKKPGLWRGWIKTPYLVRSVLDCTMANKSDKMSSAFKAEDRSSASERRDQQIFHDLRKERVDSDAKTARLKALRLEKEAAEAAELAANPPPPKKTRARVKAKV